MAGGEARTAAEMAGSAVDGVSIFDWGTEVEWRIAVNFLAREKRLLTRAAQLVVDRVGGRVVDIGWGRGGISGEL